MIAVVRIRGSIGATRPLKTTLRMLKLPSKFSMRIIDPNQQAMGMINSILSFITWGEVSQEIVDMFKNKVAGGETIFLRPPRGGMKSMKMPFPKGDVGYRGEQINDLIKKMI
ncbi:MAG: uL30 family ribosomal protein [Candidatus Aenigmatarchaeota archaeon]